MWAPIVVELDPVTDDAAGVLDILEAVAMGALLLQCANHPFPGSAT